MRLDRAKAKRYNIYITRRRGSPACGSPSRLQRGRMKGNGPRARRGHMIVCVSTGWNSHACETTVFYGIAAANAACILIERKKGPVETETGALTCLLEMGAQGGQGSSRGPEQKRKGWRRNGEFIRRLRCRTPFLPPRRFPGAPPGRSGPLSRTQKKM